MKSIFTEAQLDELLSGDELGTDLMRLIETSSEHRAEAIRILGALGTAMSWLAQPRSTATLEPAAAHMEVKGAASPWQNRNGLLITLEPLRISFTPGRGLQASGMEHWAAQMQSGGIHLGEDSTSSAARGRRWAFPLHGDAGELQVTVIAPDPPTANWKLQLSIEHASADIPEQIGVMIQQRGTELLDCKLKDVLGIPFDVPQGASLLILQVGENRHEIPFEIGE